MEARDVDCRTATECAAEAEEIRQQIAAFEAAEKAKVDAKAAEYAKSPAAFKRDDYEKIAEIEASERNSFTAQAKRFAISALEVISYGLSVPREKAMP